ncbi:hypothetical protein J1N35_029828 [Gossypium stocksii]|uniref:Uncharacterized protein n=1 Tax=Gossypium stocksii TaxID=47602 RepID=A0A9D3UYN3_9ROSI|nr:hypothetical protein J1N35_029828 [Gossypium stocksii]
MEAKDEYIHYNTKIDLAYEGDKCNDLNNITHLDNMNIQQNFDGSQINEDVCLADNATTHMILKDKKDLSHLTMSNAHVNTISGSSKLIKGSRRAIILLPKVTHLSFL